MEIYTHHSVDYNVGGQCIIIHKAPKKDRSSAAVLGVHYQRLSLSVKGTKELALIT